MPPRPAPQDHKPKKTAQQREAESEVITATVEWPVDSGETYTVTLNRNEMSLDLLEALEDGKMTVAVRELFGPKQWAAFKATKPGVTGLTDVMDRLTKALGFVGAGESSASSA